MQCSAVQCRLTDYLFRFEAMLEKAVRDEGGAGEAIAKPGL